MSKKEARRPGLVEAALAGEMPNRVAAGLLGISVRQFQRLRVRFRDHGEESLCHGNRGRASPRRLAEPTKQRILTLLAGQYAGMNDSHLTEKLREVEGIAVSRETVRRLRRAAGIDPKRKRRGPRHCRRREREAHAGALVLIDGSAHAWFGPEHGKQTLIGAIDDATGAICALVLRPTEDLHGYTQLLEEMAQRLGLPRRLYGDRHGILVRNDSHWTREEELRGKQDPTHFGRMLAELGIDYLKAHSPEAKGRIERLWNTLQDRWPVEFRLRGVRDPETARKHLAEMIADHNRRFALPARETVAVWRKPPGELDQILSCRYRRKVGRDNVVSVAGRWMQLPKRRGGASWHPAKVEVRELLDGRLCVFHDNQLIATQASPSPTFQLVPRKHPVPRRIDNPSPRPKAAQADRAFPSPQRITPPRPQHPWRGSYKRPDMEAAL